jgi:hypothetical protein
VYGTIPGLKDLNGADVKVYKKDGAAVTDAQMTDAVNKLITGRNAWTPQTLATENGKIVAIYITDSTSANYHYKNDKNLEVRFDKTEGYMGGLLAAIGEGDVTPGMTAMLRPVGNALKLALVRPPRQLAGGTYSPQSSIYMVNRVKA